MQDEEALSTFALLPEPKKRNTIGALLHASPGGKRNTSVVSPKRRPVQARVRPVQSARDSECARAASSAHATGLPEADSWASLTESGRSTVRMYCLPSPI
jgi:hypothetical protein